MERSTQYSNTHGVDLFGWTLLKSTFLLLVFPVISVFCILTTVTNI